MLLSACYGALEPTTPNALFPAFPVGIPPRRLSDPLSQTVRCFPWWFPRFPLRALHVRINDIIPNVPHLYCTQLPSIAPKQFKNADYPRNSPTSRINSAYYK